MVYVKRLEMRGFKSFGPKKATISLDKGITVITGPNGTGKSNILDAVRFVLGEMGVRSLRADKMAEVIFDGTPKVKRSDSAYVSMQFDNTDRRIPVDADSVTISREVHRDGTSIYRLNGKQVLRSKLMDVLGVSGLTSSGYNIIMQGTVTRMADITPNERRAVIEGMIGIAEYDMKKVDANEQLNQADINLRVASAKIDEVQKRFENLEIERNDAQRYNFIQGEIRRLQAILASQRMRRLQRELDALSGTLNQKNQEAEVLRNERVQLIAKRESVEQQRRELEEDFSRKGETQLLNLQKDIGDVKAQVVSLRMDKESATMHLKALEKAREERIKQLEELKKVIQASSDELHRLRNERNAVMRELNRKKSVQSSSSAKLTEMKQRLRDAESRRGSIEDEINELNEETLKVEAKIQEVQTKRRVASLQLRALNRRRSSHELNLRTLRLHLKDLEKLEADEKEGFSKAFEILTHKLVRSNLLSKNLVESERIVQNARGILTEYALQRRFAENLSSHERALKVIEKVANDESIGGIYGRLADMVKLDSRYKKAFEVASDGWLNALVVKDLETALKVLEILKSERIGRVKIISVKDSRRNELSRLPNIEGVLGFASDFIESDERSALSTILGNTVITSGWKPAILAAKAGLRAVDLNGNVYYSDGRIEGGWHSPSFESIPLIPSSEAVDSLHKDVEALEAVAEKRMYDIDAILGGVYELLDSVTLKSGILGSLENELKNVIEVINRIEKSLRTMNKKIEEIGGIASSVDGELRLLKGNLRKIKHRRGRLLSERELLKRLSNLSELAREEDVANGLDAEINELERSVAKLSGDIKFLESSIDSTLKPEHARVQLDSEMLEKQILAFQSEIRETDRSLEKCSRQLSELEKAKEKTYEDLASIRPQRKALEDLLDEINAQISEIDRKNQPIGEELHQIDLDIQKIKTEMEYLKKELYKLGYIDAVTESDEPLDAEPLIEDLTKELGRLGSVNQLAIQQYDGLKENYKQLSVRRNQLEDEKKSILLFIEELERKKRETFMASYSEIGSNFKSLFSKLTGGGDGWLQLQNPEDPLTGGIDVFVQFPGKSPRLVAGVSGGEKSVVAVSFILAIQSLSSVPFYLFDEIDAHLDSYNAERLADLLVEQSRESQFIVITLRDVVLSRSEKIFGVYNQEGVSKIVSIDLKEASA